VQGVVNFVDNGPEDGGLVLVEGSQDIFNQYMDNNRGAGFVWEPANMADPLLCVLPLIKICAPAGHILLWDSRIFHCNINPNEGGNYRMCTYVSMQPRVNAVEKELAKRIKLYEDGRLTGHWCYGPYFTANANAPRYDNGIKPKNMAIAGLNPRRRRLIGY
jgi:hypothetical protein